MGDGVHGLEEALLSVSVDVVKQPALYGGMFDAVDPYAGSFGGDAVGVNCGEQAARGSRELARIGRCDIERVNGGALYERGVGIEAIGGQENAYDACRRTFFAQLFGHLRAEVGQGRVKFASRANGVAERARRLYGFARRGDGKLKHRFAVEFTPSFFPAHSHELFDLLATRAGELPCGVEPHLFEFRHAFTSNSPYVAQIGQFHRAPPLFRRVDEAAASIAFVLFGKTARELGQSLGGGYADADRDAGPTLYNLREVAAEDGIVFRFGENDEALVDAVLFHLRNVAANNRHHAAGHVAIEGIVAR